MKLTRKILEMKYTKILLFTTVFFLQAYLLRFSIGPYPSNLQEILIGITFLVFLIESLKEKNLIQKIKKTRNHWIILSFIGLTILSIILVPIKENLDLIRHLKFLFFAVVLGFIFLETFKSSKERKKAIKIAGLGAITFGIFSAVYNLLGYNVAHDLRLLGPLDAAVYLAYYLTPFFLFFTIQFFENPKNKENFVCSIILLMLIFLTRSMGAIGGAFLVIFLYLTIRNWKKILRNKKAKVILTITAILLIGAVFYSKILPTITTPYSSLDERGEIWQTSAYLLEKPKNLFFGVGYGQFEYHYIQNVDNILGREPLDYNVIQPHNIFLLFIFHYGILGLAFITFCIYKTIRKITKLKHKKLKIEQISLFILLYFFIHGLIDTPFYKNDLMILLIIFLEMGLTKKEKIISNLKPNPKEHNTDLQL
ncbi:hypothetical protein GF366_03395 [Candidatus Peregrinibacteria bacterium]|nr:hypothetical protein [Candidatus Peregrinibacteria bacterium]